MNARYTIVAIVLALALLGGGCAYRGGKVIDGTNLAIGITIPGTEWTINALDYVGGMRVAGNDSTRITVTHEVNETNAFFGCVTTVRHTRLTAEIEPLETSSPNDSADSPKVSVVADGE